MITKIIYSFNYGFKYGIGYTIGSLLGFIYMHPVFVGSLWLALLCLISSISDRKSTAERK